jgi:hypothetical protein
MRVAMITTARNAKKASPDLPDAALAGSVEALRLILVQQQRREVAHDEAGEVATSLLEFYQLLADEVCDDVAS